MNLNDLLYLTRELSELPARVKLLWFMQSFALEHVGNQKFEAAIRQLFPQRFDAIDGDGGWAGVRGELEKLTVGDDALHKGALELWLDFMEHYHEASGEFYRTNVGKPVWDTLDWCLEERRPCFIEGREGRGKTTAARAWHEAHRGESRYISLPGLRTQRDFFEALASAYGVNFSVAKAPNEIRWRVTDAIKRSGLIPIFDEAHHALPERHRNGRPPLIDWIDCDLCNAGVPVVLISTPQFGPLLSEFENHTKWNAGQFRRRFSGRWVCLPEWTTEADFTALAERALPRVGAKGIKLAVGYAGTFDRDVSGLFDLVRDAERRARKAGHSAVTYQDLREAYELDRVPSENAMANAFKRPTYAPPIGREDTLPEDRNAPAAPLQRNRLRTGEDDVSPGRNEELLAGTRCPSLPVI